MNHTINMQIYHTDLPHQSPIPFITDGGLETTLVFHERHDLPCFAAFPLLKDDAGRELLRKYYSTYAHLAVWFGVGFVLESPGWRGNPDWAEKLDYSPAELDTANRDGIRLMHEILAAHETPDSPMVISGAVGPRGDGYKIGATMSPEQAARYHTRQIRAYRDAGADLVSAFTMTYADEALGIANAAASLDIPSVISFTLETDGRLPSGQPLREGIEFWTRALRARTPPAAATRSWMKVPISTLAISPSWAGNTASSAKCYRA